KRRPLLGTRVPVEEPSTASGADSCSAKCYVRFRPQAHPSRHPVRIEANCFVQKIVGQFEIPAVYYFREEAAEGGLLAYAAREKSEAIRRARKLARKQAIREGLNFVRLECCPALHDMPSLYVGPAHVLGDDATHRRCT